MATLFETLEHGKIGIFESPTGTGKSMSLICGALKWLTHYDECREAEIKQLLVDLEKPVMQVSKTQLETQASVSVRKNLPDWITSYSEKRGQKEEAERIQRERAALLKREKRLAELKKNLQSFRKGKRKCSDMQSEDFLESARADIKDSCEQEFEQIEDDFLLNEAELQDAESDEEEEEVHVTKIYFCSRTHSQLSQFVGEVKKSPYRDSTLLVTLGSRQGMCINQQVTKLGSLNLINDRCKELLKTSSKKGATSCPYYNTTRMNHLTDIALSDVRDIEDLVIKGRKVKACPYYAARRAIPAAQFVVLPYNTLLHNSTRTASGIKLSGNVLIIDEAHNLLETISNIHNVEVSLPQFLQTNRQLMNYRDKYKSRLLPVNLLRVSQLIHVIGQFVEFLSTPPGAEETKLIRVSDFLTLTQLDNINFFLLLKFLKSSQIARKLARADDERPDGESSDRKSPTGITSLLKKVESEKMLPEKSMEPSLQDQLSADGQTDKPPSIRYLLLNPAVYFSNIVKECRSVVIAGGTMQPVAEFKEQLFLAGTVDPERITEFTCGHVIPDENVLPIALSKYSNGALLDFTYRSRNEKHTLDSLCELLIKVCRSVPGGVVCFLPSYQYEGVLIKHMHSSAFFQTLNSIKKIFREPKKANMVENVLASYSKATETKDGGLLFSVVGGKMSEGINFSDRLCRCVIMVGLPYPNKFSPELKEKMRYLDSIGRVGGDGLSPGQVHYENLCMKAVNQSIGRAIRHRNDYACMLLLDHRYHQNSTISKLPGWLNKRVRKETDLSSALAQLHQFFTSHSKRSL
ncbi:ATP-dependent DNA helicase DDX11-like isoform X2 [Watersipora subatra]|uniref:ATP-dependent DNA helicase DDX11-like isoform X2 n=1 Tax=Watersipora subatra TaxID=2589382 RepID=UPI00355AE945